MAALKPPVPSAPNRGHMHYSTLILKNVARRGVRSLLTVLGVAVAVGAVVALVGIARGLESSLLDLLEGRGIDLIVIRAGSTQRVASTLDESLAPRIAALDNVAQVSATLVDIVSFHQRDLFGITIQGWPPDSFLFRDIRIVQGRLPQEQDQRAVILGRLLADNLGKRVGDTLEVIEGEPFRIVGIYESYNVFENGSMVMALADLQHLMGREGEATLFSVVARDKDAASIERLRDQVKGLAPALEAMPTREYVETSNELRMARAAAWLTSTVALVIGAIGTLNTMVMSVYERTREIGVLRAIGWRRWSVMRMILIEAMLLGIAGAVVGTLGAVVLLRLLGSAPAAGRLLTGGVDPWTVAQGFTLAVAVGLLGGAYPALRAARLPPTEALRHE